MRYVNEYRDSGIARALAGKIRAEAHHDWIVMEICGGQTHTIVKHALAAIIPEAVSLVHGPGCPVCVTPAETIDHAIEIVRERRVTLCSFGDMVRVPGSTATLAEARAQGGDVRVVYSPLDCLHLAAAEPDRDFVFLAVGFETTAPVHATAILQAEKLGLRNLSFLISIFRVPPAVEMILSSDQNRVNALLAAGHVCSVMGLTEYERLASRFRVPVVATGFEPVDILQGVLLAVRQLEAGSADVCNQYTRAVRREGNRVAKAAIEEVFHVTDRQWRGLGEIPVSGLSLRPRFAGYDASLRFEFSKPSEPPCENRCRAGQVLRGLLRPPACPEFRVTCSPDTPLGAPMVSSEGACAAYYRYENVS